MMESLAGKTFFDLTVISLAGKINGRTSWNCQCSCGSYAVVSTSVLAGGLKSNCGCKKRDDSLDYSLTHGHARKGAISKEFLAWTRAKYRCYRKNDRNYVHYGARGIQMCDRWRYSFQNFFDDMGPRPSDGHSLDRIDVNGNYEPGNCRWATIQQQSVNKRRSILVELGPTLKIPLKELAELTGLPYKNLFHRYKYKSQHPLEAVRDLYAKRYFPGRE